MSRAAATTALLITLLSLAALALNRGLRDKVDWSYWRLAAEAVQRDGLPPLWSETYGYPPHVPLLWMPLTLWIPPAIGVTLYVAACTAMAWWIVRTVGREWIASPSPAPRTRVERRVGGPPPTHWTLTQLLPVALVLVHTINSFQQNQLTIPVLFGVVLGLTLVRRGRPWIGGALLGATISIKLMPLPIIGILLIKRCGRAVVAATLGGFLFAAVPCLLYYGPQRTLQASTEWLWRLRLVAPDSQIRHFPLLDPDRSQALVSVLCRWFSDHPASPQARIIVAQADDALALPAQSYFNTTPPTLRARAPRQMPPESTLVRLPPIVAPRIAQLTPEAIQTIYWSLAGMLVVGTIVVTRRAFTASTDRRFYGDMSLALLVGVLLSPVLFAYYLVWAYPAWALLLSQSRVRGAWFNCSVALVAVSWLAAQAGLLSPVARQCGANLWATLLLAVALVALHRENEARKMTPAPIVPARPG